MGVILRMILMVVLLASCTQTISQQHAVAIQGHVYITDKEQYGREDVWRPSLKGDCEDYALWMRERLGGQLLYVKTESGDYHIVLDVDGVIVDNLSRDVYPRENMNHKLIFALTDQHVQLFLKRRN